MSRTKVTEPPKPEAALPVSLLRTEEREERVDITADQKVDRLNIAAGLLHSANELFGEAADFADKAKNTKKAAEAKRAEGERVLFDAQTGTMLRPYPVIVERHPVRPAEMLVWRVADGMSASDLMELDSTEQPRTEEDHIAAREAQGCTLLETRAMTPDELTVAQAEDRARANPVLPMEGLDPPANPEADATEGHSDEAAVEVDDDDDDDGDGDEDEDEDEDDGDGDGDGDATLEAGDPPTDEEIQVDNAPGETGPWKADEDGAADPERPAKKGKAANPNVIARVRIALHQADGPLNITELAEKTDHHADDIRLALEQLVEEGFTVKTGKARGTKYAKATPAVEPAAADEADVEVQDL